MDLANSNKSSSDNGATTHTAKDTGLRTGEQFQSVSPSSDAVQQKYGSWIQLAIATYLRAVAIARQEPPTT